MSDLSFSALAQNLPAQLSPEMHERYLRSVDEAGVLQIDPSARFEPSCRLGLVRSIGANCYVGAYTTLKDDVALGDEVKIYEGSVLEAGVTITTGFNMEPDTYFAKGAMVLPLTEPSVHKFLRKTAGGLIVGPRVTLPSEVQLGYNAVIPTSDSIAQIGRYGSSRRMVTVYGSFDEPLYSVGCQYGITLEHFKDRVKTNEGTDAESAADYAKHMSEIEALGPLVQAAFEREENLVQELFQQRDEALPRDRSNIY